MKKAKEYVKELFDKTSALVRRDKRIGIAIGAGLAILFLYAFSLSQEDNRKIMYEAKKADFTKGRILGSQEYGFVKDKERSLQKLFAEYKAGQKLVMDRLKDLEAKRGYKENESSKK